MTKASTPIRVVSSLGHPRAKSTWSGTPAAILAALDKAGAAIEEHTVSVPRALQYLYGATNLVRGLGRVLPDKVGLWRFHLRRAATALTDRLGPGTYLHFGSGHLPLLRTRPDQRHYLVTDYSMRLVMVQGRLGQLATARYRETVVALEKVMADQLDAVFSVSRWVRDDWLTAYELAPSKVVAIGTGLGNPIMMDGRAKDYSNGHLLYVGKHGFDIKGGQLLVDGFLEALKARPDLKLVLICDANDPAILSYLPIIKAHPSMEFHQSGTPDFVDLVRGAALYAAPADREPWGLIYLESLMCETPVLGLNRNAMMELTDNGRVGFIVEEASAPAIGQALVEAMSDPDRLQRMGREGREFVEANFTWDRVAETMLDRMNSRR
jgi:glycosyltransferase involved in cell wall biosynthesis